MAKSMLGQRVAVLVANGFEETDMTAVQRKMQEAGATVRIVSMDHGLVNSWRDNGWGLNFPADMVLSSALSADFDMLVIPGGQRSMDKLKLTAHTRRFVGGFMMMDKPVVAYKEAADLLKFIEQENGNIMMMDAGQTDGMVDFMVASMAAPMKDAA